jgi:hypothetical protein
MAITKIQSESLNLADTYDFTGTVTGAGESNVPYFYAKLSTNQDTANGGTRIVELNSVIVDSASAWNSSNYRWTVPSGQAGTYFISGSVQSRSSDNNSVAWNIAKIYINGSELEASTNQTANTQSNYVQSSTANVSVIRTLSVGDYVSLYGITYAGGTPRFGPELSSLKIFKVSS